MGTAKTVILLHPIALTRKFWNYHASILSQKYRVFTLDLPAHGSRMDERMSTRSAHSAILSLMKEVEIPPRKCVIWGHGMGGYIALTFGGIYPNLCSGITATDCGEVRDLSSSALWMASQSLQLAVTKNSTLASRPREELKNNQIEPNMVLESFLRPGTYYHGWDGILETINVTNYSELIRNYSGKMLFMNGSECAQGAQERFVGAAQEATLEIIMGGNPWFIVDERHRQKALQVVDDFLESIDWTQTIGEDGETFFEDVAIDSPRATAAQRDAGNELNRKKQELEEQHSSNSAQNAAEQLASEENNSSDEVKQEEEPAEPLETSEEILADAVPEDLVDGKEEEEKEAKEVSSELDSAPSGKGLPPAVIVENPEPESDHSSESIPEVEVSVSPPAEEQQEPEPEEQQDQEEDTSEAVQEPTLVQSTDYPEAHSASDPDESNAEKESTITVVEQAETSSDVDSEVPIEEDPVPIEETTSEVEEVDDAEAVPESEPSPQEEEIEDNTGDLPVQEEEEIQEEAEQMGEEEEIPPAVLPDAVSVTPPLEEETPVVIVEDSENQ